MIWLLALPPLPTFTDGLLLSAIPIVGGMAIAAAYRAFMILSGVE